MNRLQHWLLFTMATSSPAFAFSFPEWSENKNIGIEASPDGAYNFAGTVRFPNCSGSLVRFSNSLPEDKALVLTNGHCVRMIPPGEVMTDQPARRNLTLLNSTGNSAGQLRTTRLLYATMTRTDVGLYELDTTYEAIQAASNIEPLTLSDTAPELGTEIEILSSYWRRGYSCSIEHEVFQLKEADWLMERSLRFSRPGCETIGGTSGSPVVDRDSRMVVAINNTGNENGDRCTLNNPCEINEEGQILFQEGYSYSQQIFWLSACRDSQRNWDLNAPGCELPKPQR